ncbi:MAG: AAA family ATPase [Gracilibacteraceae bacterium]|jgi:hypothetical protein|nr:AAA family ATPase [Gracilibacteraceae bacterium]
MEPPQAIQTISSKYGTLIKEKASKDFLKYFVALDYMRTGAIADGDAELAGKLNKWFDDFQEALREIYDCKELKLQFSRNDLSVRIEMPERESFGLLEMADEYKAFFDIYMELLLRLDVEIGKVEYDMPAIALIDEIEAHLHVELQKRVLPFLTRVFPNVQFIVATHSPFVITSLENAVVFDLEKKEQLENPSIYSYEAIIEGYLDVGQYSNEIKNKFNRYKELCKKEQSAAETAEFRRLVSELELVPPASKELYFAFRAMEDQRKR